MIGCDRKSGTRRNSREVLCSFGASLTSHRVQIANLVFQHQHHVAAEEICEQLNVRSRHVSRVTVYNTLKILVDHGFLREVTVEASRVLFDSNISPYHHLSEIDSGELKDIEAEQFEILEMPEPPLGKSVTGVNIVAQLKSTG